VTSSPAAAQHLRDLAWLRRVLDRIDREYAQRMPSCVAQQVTRPIRNREAPVTEPQLA
jgi:hypothetical protein